MLKENKDKGSADKKHKKLGPTPPPFHHTPSILPLPSYPFHPTPSILPLPSYPFHPTPSILSLPSYTFHPTPSILTISHPCKFSLPSSILSYHPIFLISNFSHFIFFLLYLIFNLLPSPSGVFPYFLSFLPTQNPFILLSFLKHPLIFIALS